MSIQRILILLGVMIFIAGGFVLSKDALGIPWWLEISILAIILVGHFIVAGFVQEATGRSVRDVTKMIVRGRKTIPSVSVVLQCETETHHAAQVITWIESHLSTDIFRTRNAYKGTIVNDRTFHIEILGDSLDQTELEEFTDEEAFHPRQFHIHLHCENPIIRHIPKVLHELSDTGRQISEHLHKLGSIRCDSSSYLLQVRGWNDPLDIDDIPGKPFPTQVRRTENELQLFGSLSPRALKDVRTLVALHSLD